MFEGLASPFFIITSKLQQKMYPKLKVRTEGEGHEYDCTSLKDVPFLSLQDSCFPVKEYPDISPPRIARVPKSYVPNIILPTDNVLPPESASEVKEYRDISPPRIARVPNSYVPNIILPTNTVLPTESASEEADKKSNSDVEDRPNIRASSVARPRAVLSSPDNDAVIGNRNRNRVKALQPSALKNHNRHTQCKTAHDQAVGDQNSPSLRKLNNTTDSKIDLKVKKGSATTTPRRSVMASKQSAVRI
ncbi:uncharacterized protein [Euphorbia lathyris]|uniref:uncharacterized protein isoform X1 n=1 Tax=Euphorbia lathyris TaxID=212925 RepID=UPI0033143A6F